MKSSATSCGATAYFVMEYNLDKLQKRYPDGFPLPFEASEKRVHVCDISCFK